MYMYEKYRYMYIYIIYDEYEFPVNQRNTNKW